MTSPGISLISLLIHDYDTALTFFVSKLGFTLIEDTPAMTSNTGKPKRWVVVRPPGPLGPPQPSGYAGGADILLAQAEGEAQKAMVGEQWAGRVGLFWRTRNFDEIYERLKTAGVRFDGEVRVEEYGRVVVWEDIWGNKWDLLGLASGEE